MSNEKLKGELTVRSFSENLSKYEGLVQKLLPKHFPAERMINLAVTAFMKSPQLRECSMISIVNSVAIAAQLGLEPNTSLGHGWLIPYNRVCQFQPGYRGLIHLALRSDRVRTVSAHIVHEEDGFEVSYGTDGKLIHVPEIRAQSQEELGEWLGAYSLIHYREVGGQPSYLFLPRWDIEQVRNRSSQSWQKADSPWQKWPSEMWRKTAVKRHLKYEELSPLASRAIGYDDQSEAGKMQDPIVDIDYSVMDAELNPEAHTDKLPAGEPLKDRVTRKIATPAAVTAAKSNEPTFGSKEDPVEWPDSFSAGSCWWNGDHYVFDEATGNYKKG